MIGLLGAAVCLGMMIATGSMAVTIIAAIAAMMEPLLVGLGARRGEGIQPQVDAAVLDRSYPRTICPRNRFCVGAGNLRTCSVYDDHS